MNYGISSVEWVTALLRFNWLRNMRERESGEFHTNWHGMCKYVNVCVCVEGLGKDGCLSGTPENSGMWVAPWVTSLQRAAVTHFKRSQLLAHTHRERLFGEDGLEYDNNDSSADNLRQSCSPPSASPVILLVFHLTSPPSPFSLWNAIQKEKPNIIRRSRRKS